MEAITENLSMESLKSSGILDIGMNVLVAIGILIVGLWISKKIQKMIINIGKKSPHLDETLFKFLASIVRYVIMAFVFIAILGRFGVETTSIIAVLGAASLAVGLALQGSLANLAAGVMLMVFRPFKVGDFVEAAGTFGNVQEIELFTTIMQTFDNQQIIIPNGKIWGEKIINHSHHPVRGVEMKFNIAYDDDITKARKVILDTVLANPNVVSDPAPFIEVETLTERAAEVLVRAFTKGEHYFDVRYSLPEEVLVALGKAKMTTPYPRTKVDLMK
jgi:small conductance mechanosensitive channel